MKIYIEIESNMAWVSELQPSIMEDMSAFHYGLPQHGEHFSIVDDILKEELMDYLYHNCTPVSSAKRSKLYELEI